MKVSREAHQRNRDAIVVSASTLFRTHGYERVNLSTIMRDAGLTIGAFYGHFESKQALFAEAVRAALNDKLSELVSAGDHRRLEDFVSHYLSETHVLDQGAGCPLAGFAKDCSLVGGEAARSFTSGTKHLAEWLAKAPRIGGAKPIGAGKGEALLAMLMGYVMLARATGNPAKVKAILRRAKAATAEFLSPV